MPGMKQTMDEFNSGNLHSGSKMGPRVTNPRQAVAIGLNEARKAGQNVPPPGGGGGTPSSLDRLMRAKGHRFGAVGYE